MELESVNVYTDQNEQEDNPGTKIGIKFKKAKIGDIGKMELP